ncbi:MAG: hypothetical protein EAZ66_04345 [Alphaproteobacteria bacterium]|nr:MAG: hypothetical protein EAZ66_04345 [Alphaproteobacteria bacterium]
MLRMIAGKSSLCASTDVVQIRPENQLDIWARRLGHCPERNLHCEFLGLQTPQKLPLNGDSFWPSATVDSMRNSIQQSSKL